MRLATQQYQVLQLMGIPVWELRSQQGEAIPEAAPALSVDLTNISHVVICELPAEACAEQRLLNAILIAIRFPLNSVAVLTAKQAELQQTDLMAKTVISFAEVELKIDVTCLPPLKEQLMKPELKSVVWSTLKASI